MIVDVPIRTTDQKVGGSSASKRANSAGQDANDLYVPAVIYTRDRNRYLRALRRADNGDSGPLGELIARSVTNNLYRFVVPAVAGPHRLVPIVSLATKAHSVATLPAAIERGRLRGQKGPDGQWRSTRVWVNEYVASKYKRRP